MTRRVCTFRQARSGVRFLLAINSGRTICAPPSLSTHRLQPQPRLADRLGRPNEPHTSRWAPLCTRARNDVPHPPLRAIFDGGDWGRLSSSMAPFLSSASPRLNPGRSRAS